MRPLTGPHYRFEIRRYKILKSNVRKDAGSTHGFAASPMVGSGGHCRYPEDRVPPHASSKSRRRARRALMRAHVSRGSSSRLLTQGNSGATTCPAAPAPTSRLRAAPKPPHVLWLPLPPPTQGSSGAVICPVSPASQLRAALGPSCVPWGHYGLGAIKENKYPMVT
jgi:hypothetical protein